jgi:hypothetical protein
MKRTQKGNADIGDLAMQAVIVLIAFLAIILGIIWQSDSSGYSDALDEKSRCEAELPRYQECVIKWVVEPGNDQN